MRSLGNQDLAIRHALARQNRPFNCFRLWFLLTALMAMVVSSVPRQLAASSTDVFGAWEDVFLAPGMMRGIAFGNSVFVAVGDNGVLYASHDGLSWSRLVAGYTIYFGDVLFAQGRFIAAGSQINGDQPVVLLSEDGFNWTRGPLTGGAHFRSLAFGHEMYVGASDDALYTSPDGLRWRMRPFKRPFSRKVSFHSVAFGNGTFVATGVWITTSSVNGIDWTGPNTQFDAESGYAVSGVAFGNGVFVAVTSGTRFGVSADGENWTIQRLPIPGWNNQPIQYFVGVGFVNGRFIMSAAGLNGAYSLFTSTDGFTWTSLVAPLDTITAFHYENGLYLAVGGRGGVATSPDLVNWTIRIGGNDTGQGVYESIAANDHAIVAVGTHAHGLATSSTDEVTWATQELAVVDSLADVAASETNFVAIGRTRTQPCVILSSSDGGSWTVRHSDAAPGMLNAITFGGGRYVAVGNEGRIMTSPDGENWSRAAGGMNGSFIAVAHGNGVFVAAGNPDATGSPILLVSTNGLDWQRGKVPPGKAVVALAFGYGKFAAIRSAGPYLTSTNGFDWTSHDLGGTFPGSTITSSSLGALGVANGWFIAGDYRYQTLTWISNDLEKWSRRPPIPGKFVRRGGHAFAARGDHIQRAPLLEPPTRLSVKGTYSASKAGEHGAFTLRRDGSLGFDLEVELEPGGSAILGADVPALPTRVVLPAGQAETTIPVIPYLGSTNPGTRTLTLTAHAGEAYAVSAENSATILIVDAGSAPRIRPSTFQHLPDGAAVLAIETPASGSFVVEGSADLKTWTPLQSITANGGVVEIRDPAPGAATQRFYRLRSQ